MVHVTTKIADWLCFDGLLGRLEKLVGRLVMREAMAKVVSCSAVGIPAVGVE